MAQRSILLLNLVLILSLAFEGTLSGVLIPGPVAIGASPAPATAWEPSIPDLAPGRVKRQRTQGRPQHRPHQSNSKKHKQPKDQKQKSGKADRKQKHKKKDHSSQKAGSGQSAEDHYIVILEPSAGSPEQAAEAVAVDASDVTVTQVYEHVFDGFAAVIPADQLDAVRTDPRVQAVVPDQEVHAFAQTLPTGINRIDADQNPPAKIDGVDERVDVDVAVLDTGITADSDLNVAGGISCLAGDTSYADDNGHGTHVAGTIGALDNDSGVVGVAPGARLWAVKVLDADSSGWRSDVICGLDWVAANSGTIDVVNMSLGGGGSDSSCSGDDALHGAICRVVDGGVPVIVSAGNDGMDAANVVPAAYDEVITVSALADSDGLPGGVGAATTLGPDDSLASFSNFGADVDIAAPGVSILSTVPGGYARKSGTSMASPHVAGAAALYLQNHPGANPAEVKANLLSTRKDIALPNDHDGINEGVLYVGSGSAPKPPTTGPAPSPGKKGKKHKKGGGKKGGRKKKR
jgi:subtilisin